MGHMAWYRCQLAWPVQPGLKAPGHRWGSSRAQQRKFESFCVSVRTVSVACGRNPAQARCSWKDDWWVHATLGVVLRAGPRSPDDAIGASIALCFPLCWFPSQAASSHVIPRRLQVCVMSTPQNPARKKAFPPKSPSRTWDMVLGPLWVSAHPSQSLWPGKCLDQ